jgi:hypothetical protein
LHFAYTGHRRPVLLAGMDPEDSSYLTPIPANQPAKLSLSTVPTTVPARAPMETEKEGATPSPVPSKHVTGVAASPALENAFISTPIQTQDQPTAPPLRLPDCPHPQARLMTPKVNQVIEDKVEVMGTANIDNFAYYKFEFKSEDIEDEWHWVESFETPVEEGVLGTWDISNLPPGNYILRLTVVDRTGNYPFTPCEVSVYVAH